MKRAAALAFSALGAGSAAGAPPAYWHARLDNDVAFRTDRWYTSGVRLYRSLPLEGDSRLASFLRAPSARPYRVDVGIVHEVYTSDGRADPALADRPNAGRLLLSLARHDLAPDTLATLGIDAGVSGPAALGRESQDAIHRLIPAPETDWSRQVANRADVQAVGSWSHRVGLGAVPGSLVLHAGAVAGTIVAFGHAGIEWRTEAPAQSPNPLLRFAATPPMPPGEGGLSFFGGASFRAVARNRLLERRDDDPRPGAGHRRQVGRAAAGVAWAAEWGVVTLVLAVDSREFAGQHSPHRFASLVVSLPAD